MRIPHPVAWRTLRPLAFNIAAGCIAGVAVWTLAGCAADKGPTPRASVLAAAKTLEEANRVATRYVQLPTCGRPTSPPACSNPATSTNVKAQSRVAYEALGAAQTAVDADPGAAKDATKAAMSGANAALAGLLSITASLTPPAR